ncbi:hypothetical protein AAHB47_30555 [Bacillus wiedmannii]
MMFQGFNMLTIARIGGHSSLDAQMHYFNHLEYFSQSSIQYLSDQYRKIPYISLNTEGISNDSNIKKLFSKAFLNQLSQADLENFLAWSTVIVFIAQRIVLLGIVDIVSISLFLTTNLILIYTDG